MSPLPTTENVDHPRALGYGARIDNLWLRLAVSADRPLNVETAELMAPQVNTQQTPEEFRNEFGELFSRSGFYSGEGLAFAHTRRTDEGDATRFFDSKGIDIRRNQPGEIDGAKLLPSMSQVDASGDGAQAYDGSAHYVAAGTTVRRSTNPTATSPTYANDDPHAGESATTVEDLVAVGTEVYAALGTNGIHKRSGGAWAAWSDLQATAVWAAKATSSGAFILAAKDNVLYEAKAGAGSVALVTLGTGETWVDLVDAGAAILASASNGYVYSIGLDDAGTALELKAETRLTDSGRVNALGWGGGFVFYGIREPTGSGAVGSWWRASLDTSSLTIVDSQVQKRWNHNSAGDHAVDHSPQRIITADDEIFTGVLEHGGNAFLWRYDLETAARSRSLDTGSSAGVINDLLVIDDLLFATVEGGGTYREASATFESEGYLIGPLGDLFSAVIKPWVGAFIDHQAIESDTKIELWASTDPAALNDPAHASWRLIKTISSGRDTSETAIAALEGRYLAGMVKLFASTDLQTTPKVHSFTFRAYPSIGDILISLPVIVGDTIEMPNRRRHRTRGLGAKIYAELAKKEAQNATLFIHDLDERFRGIVKKVRRPVQQMTERGFPILVAIVEFQGRRISTPNIGSGDGLLGIGTLGIATLGGTD